MNEEQKECAPRQLVEVLCKVPSSSSSSSSSSSTSQWFPARNFGRNQDGTLLVGFLSPFDRADDRFTVAPDCYVSVLENNISPCKVVVFLFHLIFIRT